MKKARVLMAVLAAACATSAWAATAPAPAPKAAVAIHVIVRDAHQKVILDRRSDDPVGHAFTTEMVTAVPFRSAISMATWDAKSSPKVIPGVLHPGWRLMILPYFADHGGDGFADVMVQYTTLRSMSKYADPRDSKAVIDLPVLDQQTARESMTFGPRVKRTEVPLWNGMIATIEMRSHPI